MKTLILFALALGLTATAQTNPATPNANMQTPSSVTNQYNTDHPNTNATWSMDGNNYRADYHDNGTNMGRSVIYDKSGKRIGTENQLNQGDYPASINDYYTNNYPGEKNYNVWANEDNAGNKTYYVKGQKETVWFDKNGKYKSKTKTSKAGR